MERLNEPRVVVIPRTIVKGPGAKDKRIRTAAYCRVSRDTEQQQASYESQVSYYRKYISEHSDWTLVRIYADDGISGMNSIKRLDFQRLIDDCKSGEIDLVITKSISRFARNVQDCVRYARELRKYGVGVQFEEERFNTLEESAEFVLTILAAVAQQESVNLSNHVIYGLEHRYKSGVVRQNCKFFLGYDYDKYTKEMTVNEAQAKTVTRIFKEYLSGASVGEIARGLEKDGVETGTGETKWYRTSVERILRNERYIGDALLRKTYTKDIFEKKRATNKGEREQYYVYEHHEPLIARETFIAAQAEMVRRKEDTDNLRCGFRSVSCRVFPYSGIMKCSRCGSVLKRTVQNERSGIKTPMWKCLSCHKKKLYRPEEGRLLESELKRLSIEAFLRLKEKDTCDIKLEAVLFYPDIGRNAFEGDRGIASGESGNMAFEESRDTDFAGDRDIAFDGTRNMAFEGSMNTGVEESRNMTFEGSRGTGAEGNINTTFERSRKRLLEFAQRRMRCAKGFDIRKFIMLYPRENIAAALDDLLRYFVSSITVSGTSLVFDFFGVTEIEVRRESVW